MSAWFVYFILKLGAIQVFFGILTGLLMAWLAITGITWGVNQDLSSLGKKYDTEAKRAKELFCSKKAWAGMILCLLIAFCVPSTQQAIVVYALPKVVNNEHVQQIPANFAKIVDIKVKEWLEGLEKTKSLSE